MKVEDSIEYFCNYFREQVKVIDFLTVSADVAQQTNKEAHQIRFYRKVLLITAMDTLAGIRFSKNRYPQISKRNQERFIKFMIESNIWPAGNLVSIPFLAEHISTGKISKGRLHDFIAGKVKRDFKDAFNLPSSDIDEPLEVLLNMATTEQEEAIIKENQHYELLYRYRNYLLHESREPGRAMEIAPKDNPYYHSYLGENRLYLAYPIGLFKKLTELSIEYMESYLKNNRFNPYDFVTETTRW